MLRPTQTRPRATDGVWIRIALLTTARMFWQCGAHTAEPKIGTSRLILPIPYYQYYEFCCFLWHVARRAIVDAPAPHGCLNSTAFRVNRSPWSACLEVFFFVSIGRGPNEFSRIPQLSEIESQFRIFFAVASASLTPRLLGTFRTGRNFLLGEPGNKITMPV